jgi:RNA polymerase sigma-70 factor (ECF subfamily)
LASCYTIYYLYIEFKIKTTVLELSEAIIKAKENNQMAFNFLLETFWNDVFGFMIKRTQNENDAEDITIETFFKAFDKINSFDSKFKFKTWLITIAKNTHLDSVRKQKKTLTNQTTEEDEKRVYWIRDDAPSAEDKLINEQNLAELLKDIKKLKPHHQEIIQLRYFQEQTYQEIASTIGIPINNVKVKLLRAKKLLACIILAKK